MDIYSFLIYNSTNNFLWTFTQRHLAQNYVNQISDIFLHYTFFFRINLHLVVLFNRARQIEAPRNSNFSEVRYLCPTCNKMIPVDYKKIHENSHLNEQNLLNCSICNKKFSSEEYLEMHMNVHNLDKVSNCFQARWSE